MLASTLLFSLETKMAAKNLRKILRKTRKEKKERALWRMEKDFEQWFQLLASCSTYYAHYHLCVGTITGRCRFTDSIVSRKQKPFFAFHFKGIADSIFEKFISWKWSTKQRRKTRGVFFLSSFPGNLPKIASYNGVTLSPSFFFCFL